MPKKPKQNHPTKEQLLQQMEAAKEAKRLRVLVTEKLWPLLLKGSTSISNAEQICQILTMSIQQAFMSEMKIKKIIDLKVREKVNPKAPQADYYAEILDVIGNETMTDATRLIEGLGDEVKRLQKKEMSERKLDTLKTDFIA